MSIHLFLFVFVFQAEDGIRDVAVTGVQTCALPIYFELKPQMFSDVMLNIDYGNQVVVPQGAVLDSGERQTVFVALPDGYFEPREIKTEIGRASCRERV